MESITFCFVFSDFCNNFEIMNLNLNDQFKFFNSALYHEHFRRFLPFGSVQMIHIRIQIQEFSHNADPELHHWNNTWDGFLVFN